MTTHRRRDRRHNAAIRFAVLSELLHFVLIIPLIVSIIIVVGTFLSSLSKMEENLAELSTGKHHHYRQGTYKGIVDAYEIERKYDNKRQGQGNLSYADGSEYSGQLNDGKRHGEGTLT